MLKFICEHPCLILDPAPASFRKLSSYHPAIIHAFLEGKLQVLKFEVKTSGVNTVYRNCIDVW